MQKNMVWVFLNSLINVRTNRNIKLIEKGSGGDLNGHKTSKSEDIHFCVIDSESENIDLSNNA